MLMKAGPLGTVVVVIVVVVVVEEVVIGTVVAAAVAAAGPASSPQADEMRATESTTLTTRRTGHLRSPMSFRLENQTRGRARGRELIWRRNAPEGEM